MKSSTSFILPLSILSANFERTCGVGILHEERTSKSKPTLFQASKKRWPSGNSLISVGPLGIGESIPPSKRMLLNVLSPPPFFPSSGSLGISASLFSRADMKPLLKDSCFDPFSKLNSRTSSSLASISFFVPEKLLPMTEPS